MTDVQPQAAAPAVPVRASAPQAPKSRQDRDRSTPAGKLAEATETCRQRLEDAGSAVAEADPLLPAAIAQAREGRDVWIVGDAGLSEIVVGRPRLIDAIARARASCIYVLDVSGILRAALA